MIGFPYRIFDRAHLLNFVVNSLEEKLPIDLGAFVFS